MILRASTALRPLSLEAVPNVVTSSTDPAAFAERVRRLITEEGSVRLVNDGTRVGPDVLSPSFWIPLAYRLVAPEAFVTSTTPQIASPLVSPWDPIFIELRHQERLVIEPPRRRRERVATTAESVVSEAFESPSVTTWRALPAEYLSRRVEAAFRAAVDERFEDGVDSELSKTLVRLVQTHGSAAVSALESALVSRLANDEIAGEVLRWVGSVQHEESARYRRTLLEKALGSASSRVRYVAALALATMDDPGSIPAVRRAISQEQHEKIRRHFQRVLDQLEDTARCRDS